MIRCKVCGFITEKFHGWVFATGRCYGKQAGYYCHLHDWEAVDEENDGA